VKEVMRHCPEHWKKELIRIPALTIRQCNGCFACLSPERPCPLQDDMAFLVQKIEDADAVILAAPCYVLGPPGIIKSIQDRLIERFSRSTTPSGTPRVTMAVAGLRKWAGYTRSTLNLTAHVLGLDLKDSFLAIGANPGDVLRSERNREGARRLAEALARDGRKRKAEETECPVCLGEIFFYKGGGCVECALCGQVGSIDPRSQKTPLTFPDCPGGSRFSEKAMKQHYENWLLKKRHEYMRDRLEYKAIRNPYRKMDWWVKP
jgi:multimeric flavodoxin WrbA